MKRISGFGPNESRIIVSLCDYSGNWPKPFSDAGYTVLLFDLKHGDDVIEYRKVIGAIINVMNSFAIYGDTPEIVGIMAAPVCTDFSVSGAQYWEAKDADGRTALSLALVDGCLAVINYFDQCENLEFWVLENPVGWLPKLRPGLKSWWWGYFQPHDYAGWLEDPRAEAYTKKTGLWGRFEGFRQFEKSVPPIRSCSQGSWIQKLGGKSEKTKELRSKTPLGFARAFFEANKGE